MDGGTVKSSPSRTYQNYTEIFEEMFAHYLSIGMTYEQYWEGDPWMARHYQKAFLIQRENRNYDAWWSGYYTFVAISTALSNMHLDGKPHQPNQYLSEPIRITPLTEEERQDKAEEQERALIDRLNALKANWDRSRTENEDGTN